MASALDDDDIGSDDYYSLLNVRREVQYTVGICWNAVLKHEEAILYTIYGYYETVTRIIVFNVG